MLAMPSMPMAYQRSRITFFAVIAYIVGLMIMSSFLTKWLGQEYPYLALAPFAFGFAHFLGPRAFILKHLRRGCRAYAEGDLDTAIREMQACYDYFEAHAWIDRFRLPVLLSTSAISIREMALYNIAFFQALRRRRTEAKLGVQKLLAEFPSSILGRQMMTMIETFETPAIP